MPSQRCGRSRGNRQAVQPRTAPIQMSYFARRGQVPCTVMIPPTSPPHAVVVDANIAIAIAANETNGAQKASSELAAYSAAGCEFFAPGVLVSETLYVLCKKAEAGILSPADHTLAIQHFQVFLT